MHNHSITEGCHPLCPAFCVRAWRCAYCNRQRPMMADTESWPVQICDECYLEYYNAQDDRAEEENGAVH